VAMTRGRESNQAYLYERIAGEGEHEHAQPDGLQIIRRGTSHATPLPRRSTRCPASASARSVTGRS